MIDVAIEWIECHPGLAGWMQAIGAFISILIAMYIAHSDSRRRTIEETTLRLGELERLYELLSGCKAQFDEAKVAIIDRDLTLDFWKKAPDLRIDFYAGKVSEISIDRYPVTWEIAALHQVYANLRRAREMLVNSRTLQLHRENDKLALDAIAEDLDKYSAQCGSTMKAINPGIKVLRRKLVPWYERLWLWIKSAAD